MKRTLLDMVQNILSSMDSDNVNSISDTIEAQQVAEIIRETYEGLVALTDLPEHKDVGRLEAVSDTSRPNYLKLPDNVSMVEEFRYEVPVNGVPGETQWKDVLYMEPFDFLRLVQGRRSLDMNNIIVVNYNSVPMYIDTRTAPTYWTSFDDKYIVCDSYDASVDTTLQSSKTTVMLSTYSNWVMDDNYIPNLDANMFPRLLAEAKNMSHAVLKQDVNEVVNAVARQQKVGTQFRKHRVKQNAENNYPDYGRRGGRYSGRVRLH